MAARLRSAEFRYDVAEELGALSGVVGVRNGTHLFSLYVAPMMQRRGLARRLWNHVKERSDSRSAAAFTVNSSTNAVGIYERFGFEVTGGTVDADGVVYVLSMATILDGDSAFGGQVSRWSGRDPHQGS